MKSIVVAVDFSDYSGHLLDAVTPLALTFQAEVHLIHVVAPEPVFVGYTPYAYPGPDERAAELRDEKAKLRAMVAELETRGVRSAGAVMEEGETVPTLLRFAAGKAADVIVVGTHHHGFVERLLTGSTSESLLRRTDRPLLVIPTH